MQKLVATAFEIFGDMSASDDVVGCLLMLGNKI